MTNASPAFEFCQYVHDDGRRCVSGFGHGGNHNVQPQTSATVQAILRRETVLERLGAERPPLTAQRLTDAIDRAVESVTDFDAPGEALQHTRVREEALGSVPEKVVAHADLAQAHASEGGLGGVLYTTAGGKQLTAADIEALAAEAERGYDPATIQQVERHQEATMTEQPDEQIVQSVPTNEPTTGLTNAQPTGGPFVDDQDENRSEPTEGVEKE